ncbi:TetR/AcrR family transcriptional regulator [Mitsuaria sp. CC2]|jgi:TetR/AcrR family transcriptional regulator, transcriptional repressor for nem operon|uniref:TetR/AcrR family transcriptional regulator n=1 Tax=Mitsuaria sp. CC2 TaxID=3029186 RepID=UPI003B8C5850
MARPKQFDPDEALDAAVAVFREHGYAASSAEMLTASMGIGKQSLYSTYGGKWPLYCAALQRYAEQETSRHIETLKGGRTALEGLERLLKRVVNEAHLPCLGVGSVQEFGMDSEGSATLVEIREAGGRAMQAALLERIRDAQSRGEMSVEVEAKHAVAFVFSQIASLRLAARGGASDTELRALARLSLQALR